MADAAETLDTQHLESPAGPAGRADPVCIAVTGASGGVGKTSLVTHLAVGLLNMGVTVGVADLDVRDRGLTSWLTRRRARGDGGLVMPAAPNIDFPRGGIDVERREADRWPDVHGALMAACDVVLVDTPTGAGALTNDVIRGCDTVLSLVGYNDPDLERLFEPGPNGEGRRPSAYSKQVWEARRRRSRLGEFGPDWLICPARRMSMPAGDHERIDGGFVRAERLLGGRLGPTFSEWPSVRAAFGQGLTALDPHFAAENSGDGVRGELRAFIVALRAAGLAGAALAI